MKISIKWIQDFVDVADFLTQPAELAAILTKIGLEVEGFESQARHYQNVVVGLILEKGQHPDADRLSLCQVTTGEGVVHQIVCGARNHQKNDRVVVALPGAVLPNNFEIQKSKIRGVNSEGMLCSESELGLKSESEGILILPQDAPIGQPFAEYSGRNDILFEIKVTPNRADCLSHLGLAREIACVLNRPLKEAAAPISPSLSSVTTPIRVEVKSDELCPRFTGRAILKVKVAPSPPWLATRLEAVGLRPINNVVDVTNYVMLETGQPLHAYDLARIEGGLICVRPAASGETFAPLFGEPITLKGGELVISDQQKILGLAGIVGGAFSGVTFETQNLFIEAASFAPTAVRRSSRELNIHTDASYRFSRAINIRDVRKALDRACQLLLEVAGCEPADGTFDLYPRPHEPRAIEVSLAFVSQQLGFTVNPARFEQWLKRLGCTLEPSDNGYLCTPPSHRADLLFDVDLVEEFARLEGYDQIPEKLPSLIQAPTAQDPFFSKTLRVRRLMQGLGYQQALNFAFIGSRFQAQFTADAAKLNSFGLRCSPALVSIVNPLSDQWDVMRALVAPSLLQNLLTNYRQGNHLGQLYELGHGFSLQNQAGSPFFEEPRLAMLSWGLEDGLWQKPERAAPLALKLKSQVELLLSQLGLRSWRWEQTEGAAGLEFLHPGQQARLCLGDKPIGFMGAVHPAWLEHEKVRTAVAVGEFNLSELLASTRDSQGVVEPTRFPAIERDLALLVPKTLAVAEVQNAMKDQGQPLLQAVSVFDVFEGEGIEPGQRSVAFRLRYQDPVGTLNEQQVQELQSKVLAAVEQKYSIQVRYSS